MVGDSKNVAAGLLVSVRSLDEARVAFEAGADLIDVKEPALGSLGRASETVVREIVTELGGKVPLSMALGEWREGSLLDVKEWNRLTFVKWGLSGVHSLPSFIEQFNRERQQPHPVLVAYADAKRAETGEPEYWTEIAQRYQFTTLLFDTYFKDGSTLLDWISHSRLEEIIHKLRAAGIRVALAGSLKEEQIRQLLPLQPDWFAVRGAACATGNRGGTICRERVRGLVELIRSGRSDFTSSACTSP